MSILGRVSWGLYVVGTALVIGSWINVVSGEIGWMGWVAGMIGWGLGYVDQKSKKGGVAELERLSNLHQQGELSDEEFAAAKEKLLG